MEGLPNLGPRQVFSPPNAGSDVDRSHRARALGKHICDRPLAAAARSQFRDLGKADRRCEDVCKRPGRSPESSAARCATLLR
jgi:hypothetical protein